MTDIGDRAGPGRAAGLDGLLGRLDAMLDSLDDGSPATGPLRRARLVEARACLETAGRSTSVLEGDGSDDGDAMVAGWCLGFSSARLSEMERSTLL